MVEIFNESDTSIPGFIDGIEAYKRGFDCGINGANDWNCNFKIFNTPENTKEWERGKKNGELKKKNQSK